jgi:RNA polymerase sigma-70 factor (ECF subfamily)
VTPNASVDQGVTAAWLEGQRAWPAIALPLQTFARHLGELGIAPVAVAAQAADLYIAAACASGDQQAMVRFDAQYLTTVERYVRRLRLSPELLAELRQRMRLLILLGPKPGIGRYRGSGALMAWVRIIAVRTALELIRGERLSSQAIDERALDTLIAPELGPEAQALKGRYRDQVQAALREALSAMGDRDKTLLRLHFLDGSSIEAIGRIYGVHRATAARWLVALRRQMLQRVREALALPAGATSSELRSLVRLLEGEIELSLHRLLK